MQSRSAVRCIIPYTNYVRTCTMQLNTIVHCTVEPLNNGHIHFVNYREVDSYYKDWCIKKCPLSEVPLLILDDLVPLCVPDTLER